MQAEDVQRLIYIVLAGDPTGSTPAQDGVWDDDATWDDDEYWTDEPLGASILSEAYGVRAVFADVPPHAGEDPVNYPYVTIGQVTERPLDTKTATGGNALSQIDVWTRTGNYTQAKQIARAIYDRLHRAELWLPGTTHIETLVEQVVYSLDPDGETRRALMQVRTTYHG